MADQAKITSGRSTLDRRLVRLLFACVLIIGCSTSNREAAQVAKEDVGQAASPQPLPVYGTVPPFELTNQNGDVFRSESLNGKIYLANFFFTTCPSICPQQTREVAKLQTFEELSIVSVTVQPSIDTPDVLSRYAEQFGADTNRWFFLTGTRQQTWDLSQDGFKLAVGDAPQPTDMPIFHSSKIILVDQFQRIRGWYESQTSEGLSDLRAAIRQLIAWQSPKNDDSSLSQLQIENAGAFEVKPTVHEPTHSPTSKEAK